jgi:hypothetical protein
MQYEFTMTPDDCLIMEKQQHPGSVVDWQSQLIKKFFLDRQTQLLYPLADWLSFFTLRHREFYLSPPNLTREIFEIGFLRETDEIIFLKDNW